MFGLLALLTNQANADVSVTNISLYDSGAATAWITITGPTAPISIDVYADPQRSDSGNLKDIPLYCIDTVHDNYLGTGYSLQSASGATFPFSTTPAYTDAANRVAWALENASITTLTGQAGADFRGATQLLIWSIVDNQFTVDWSMTNNDALKTAYTTLVSTMNNTSFTTPGGYLSGAVFLSANHDGNLYQDLAYATPPGLRIASATPEPSTLVVAGLGALGFIGYGCRRRSSRNA